MYNGTGTSPTSRQKCVCVVVVAWMVAASLPVHTRAQLVEGEDETSSSTAPAGATSITEPAEPSEPANSGEANDGFGPEGQQTRRASTRFVRGMEFYQIGDYRAALIEFRRAYEIQPHYRVLYNMGQTSFWLHDYAESVTAFEGYLREGGDEIEEGRRLEVEERLDTLRAYVSSLVIRVNIIDAQVSIDNRPVGTSPLTTPVFVSAGRREITVQAQGYAVNTRVVDLAGGEQARLSFELISLSAEPGERQARLGAAFWTSVTVTGTLAVAALVTGGLTLQSNAELDAGLGEFPASDSNLDSLRNSTRRLSLTTDVLWGAVGVGVITSVLIGVLVGPVEDESEEISVTGNGVRIRF